MRIITGSVRGKKLVTPEGETVRPTSDRVKQALFNIIQFDIESRNILDLFAGSGQIGIETLSRGAAQATFVDASKDSIALVNKNLEISGLAEHARVMNMDFASFLSQKSDQFDIAFLDPPYRTGILQRALPLTAEVMNKGGTIICENPSDEELPETAGDFRRGRSYRYGKIVLTLYRHKDVVEQ